MKTVDQKNYNSEGTSTPAVKYCHVDITKKKTFTPEISRKWFLKLDLFMKIPLDLPTY